MMQAMHAVTAVLWPIDIGRMIMILRNERNDISVHVNRPQACLSSLPVLDGTPRLSTYSL